MVLSWGENGEGSSTVCLGIVVGGNQGRFITGPESTVGHVGGEERLDVVRGFVIQGTVGKNHYLIDDSRTHRKPVQVYEVWRYVVSFLTFDG